MIAGWAEVPLSVVDEVGSTQDVLMARAAAGGAEAALLARRQGAGRGQMGRRWVGIEGNLHLSVLLREDVGRWPGHWSLLAGVALHAALGVPELRLKWPNDLLLGGAKVAGVLVDAGPGWLVAGFGVNLVGAPAGLGRAVARLGAGAPGAEALARRLVPAVSAWRWRYRAEGFGPVRAAWLAAGPAPGTAVAGGAFAGLGADGGLVVDHGA